MMKVMTSLPLMGMLLLGVACTPTVPAMVPVSPTASTGGAGHSTPTLPVVTEEPSPQTAQFFLIALEDNGQSGLAVGCGDSAVPVTVEVPAGSEPLRVALETLLAIHEPYYGESGLYNALYQSDLQVQSATMEGGQAVVHLSGTLMLGGVCDNPRVQAQLEETVRQFSPTGQVAVFVNDVPLADVLSLR